LAEFGVTSVQHTGSWQELLALQHLRRQGKLRTRIYVGVPLTEWTRLRDYVEVHGRGDEWLHWGALKLFKNGYIERPGPSVPASYDRWSVEPAAEEVYGWFAGATRAGLQIMVHAGGYNTLRIYERIQDEFRPADPRFRIEHAHDIPTDWISLYAKAGVIASVQPPLLTDIDIRTTDGAPPPRNLFPCRQLLDAGVRIAFGTDAIGASPLTPPLEVIRQALQWPGADGRSMTLEQCLRAHTLDAAYAEFGERQKGSIQSGKLADLVLLDRDIFSSPASALNQAKVRMTIIGGQVIYESNAPMSH
ncbi:MAG TPA: amidohydrolase family protein, partial [Acidobacteriota bacterium]|nr:amidohydrolase family protein [Acidobacteriota bacterium]